MTAISRALLKAPPEHEGRSEADGQTKTLMRRKHLASAHPQGMGAASYAGGRTREEKTTSDLVGPNGTREGVRKGLHGKQNAQRQKRPGRGLLLCGAGAVRCV